MIVFVQEERKIIKKTSERYRVRVRRKGSIVFSVPTNTEHEHDHVIFLHEVVS